MSTGTTSAPANNDAKAGASRRSVLGPTFIVAGAARSGTTALTEALRAHPDVFVTVPKEPNYLALAGQPLNFTGPGDDVMINTVAVTSKDAYLSLYSKAHQYAATGEGSVSTLYYYEQSIPRLLSINGDAQIVLLLRDPVARAFSSFQFLRAQGYEPMHDFRAAIEDEPRRIREGWHHLWHYVGMSRYAESVEATVRAVGKDRVGIWFYDELVTEPARTLDQILRFLGADPSRLPEGALWNTNTSGAPKSQSVQSVYRWVRRHETLCRTVRTLVPFKLRDGIRRANLQSASLSADIRTDLHALFVDDLTRLSDVLARPLPNWGQ